ncbi:MAG: CapA family protein, partial [Tepidiformaceae bacterium]
AWADTASVTNAVHTAAASADLVVVMLHFGIEYATEPNATQQRLAHAAIDAGATLVIGSHPHVLQEVEEYGGGLIAYSLGNFVFDGFDGSANETAILEVTLSASGVESWKLVPVDIVKNGLPRLREE